MKYKTQLGLLLIGCIVLVGIMISFLNQNVTSETKLSNFNSYDEIKSFLQAAQGMPYGSGEGLANTPAVASADSKSAAGAAYSTTNNQVDGVDEADIVKNDGKYIYTVAGNNVIIVDADPNNMKIIGNISFEQNVRNIFINGDKLVVFQDSYGYASPKAAAVEGDSSAAITRPCFYGGCGGYAQRTMIYVYDTSDKKNPSLKLNMSADGNYVESRMIGDYIYLINSQYANIDNPMPMYSLNGIEKSMPPQDFYYFDYPDRDYVFTSVFAVNINDYNVESKVYLTGATETTFVSENNIYITSMKTIDYNDYQRRFVNDAYLPLLPSGEQQKIKEILNSDKLGYEKYNEIDKTIQDYSLSLRGADKDEFDSKLMKAQQNFAESIQKEQERTVIHKIHISGDNIEYVEQGEVPGRTLNQFSMDEYKGNLRIATTTGNTWEGKSSNNFYILDKNMNVIGKVEDLAKGESIYSARFLGDRAYLVTFKSIDPLFVIDASNPTNPRVLGYLKIPGYSNYLHPYDENHVIGIGKDVNESIDADKVHSEGAVYYTAVGGIKVSLFDVSDVENPKEQAKIVIGERGSDSLALQDHKAVLFDKEKGLLVIPALLMEINTTGDYDYSLPVWQGAVVLNIDSSSISEKGRITHFENVNNTWEWYSDQYSIKRSLYIDDTLYTISSGMIKANDLKDLNEIGNVTFPYQQQIYYGYGGGVGIAATGPKRVEGDPLE
ncbi:beta-propeller domain-containing protein [Candidatus Pacearchaeota archaeon]|nr:beta-propeller domain-containing protein [Candidatus Pacearchaeota archaeon]